jgi:hypothetical protein
MGYYSQFPKAIPLLKVDCVRVTHPCAGRHQKQAPMLPLDLHVLSLPLAFILSQDQTLHSKVKTYYWFRRTGDLSLIVRSSNSMKIIASTLFFSSSSLFFFPSRFQ